MGGSHAVGLGLELSTEIHPQFFLREGVSFLEGRVELYNLWAGMQKFSPHRCQNIQMTTK